MAAIAAFALLGCALGRPAPTRTTTNGVLAGNALGNADEFLGIPFGVAGRFEPVRGRNSPPLSLSLSLSLAPSLPLSLAPCLPFVFRLTAATPPRPAPPARHAHGRFAAPGVAGPRQAQLFNGSYDSTPLDARAFGPACLQDSGLSAYGAEHGCLVANVWAPPGATASSGLPVIGFVFGGNFDFDEAEPYNMSELAAAQNAVAFSFNYRVSVWNYVDEVRVGCT